MKKKLKYVWLFFTLTFVQTWICYLAIILFGLNAKQGLGMIFLIIGGMAPSLIGIIMALATYSKDEKKEFFQKFYQVKRIGLKWWLFVLLIFPALHAITLLITLITGGTIPTMEGLHSIIHNPVSIFPALLLGFFINGAWPEEWGWRGFGLQPLLEQFGFVKANLLIGTLWALWHMPLFLMPAMQHSQKDFIGVIFYIAQTVGLSMIMSLLHIKAKKSILSAMLLHMFFNLTLNLMAVCSHTYENIFFLLVFIVSIVIAIYENISTTKSFCKKRLGR